MKRSWKTNRVSWAPGVNLCQVKLFLKEDCPSKVGGEHQDTLQANISRPLHPRGMYANELPPGFEAGHHTGRYKCGLAAKIPRIQWKSPPKFALNFNWHVVAGEESKEAEAQKLREKRVLEAVYPRLSVIPPNPVFPDAQVERHDDDQIPLVPLTPIEDDESAELCSVIAAQAKSPSNFETPAALLMTPGLSNTGAPNMPHWPSSAAEGPTSGASSNMMAAALAALTTVMKSKEQGSLVDTDLLVKILSDPKMVEKLIHNHGHPDANLVSAPSFVPEPEAGVTSVPCSKPATMPSVNSNHLVKEFQPAVSTPVSRAETVSNPMPVRVESSSFPLASTNINMLSGHGVATAANSRMNQVKPALSVMPVQAAMQNMEANTVKDANYFKNLIREHGREKEEEAKSHNMSQTGSHLNHIQNLKPGASKIKFRKPCMFYSSSKGCRQGSNCAYLHDIKSLQWQTRSAKRMKLSGEITGRI